MDNGFQSHTMKRTGFCRGCDKTLEIGEIVAATYSIRNRGQYIYICRKCCHDVANIYLAHSFSGRGN